MALLEDLLGATGAQVAGGLLSGAGLQEAISNIQGLRSDIQQQASEYATRGAEAAAFQPFAVTTPRGTAQVGATGALTLAPEAGAMADIEQQALARVLSTLGAETPTAETLFGQMQAAVTPEQERQRIALENRLAAQGRLGTQTAAYGGTPEQLALEKAIQEQTSQNLLAATQLAPQLAQQQLTQATGLFGLGAQAQTTPQQQLIAALQPALAASQLAQTGRASEAQLLGALGPSVLQGLYKTGETEAGLQQAQINAILQGLGVQQQATTPTTSSVIVDIIKAAQQAGQ